MPNESYYCLFEMSPLAMWIFDVESLFFLDVNVAATKIYGYSKEEFLGMTMNDIQPKADMERGEFYKNTFRHLKRNGAVIHVEIARKPIMVKERAASLVMVCNIMDSRKEEEHWSKLLESVVINTSDGVLITDATSNPGPSIIYVNDALTNMSGYTREEILGKQPALLHRNNLSQKSLMRIKQAMNNKMPCNVEMINYTKTGSPYNVSVNISPVTDGAGRITHWISIQRDISKNIKYIKEIEEQNKKLKDIGWMQSHLVRSPLARIMSLVNLLMTGPQGEDTKVLLQHLSKSATDLDKVITHISSNASC